MTPLAALEALVEAIDTHAERRVLLDKRDSERRIEHIVVLNDIAPAYVAARRTVRATQLRNNGNRKDPK